MDRKKQIEICKSCKNKKFSLQQGIICSLTDAVPEFEESCPEYQEDIIVKEVKEEKPKKQLGTQEQNGKRKITTLFVILLLLSIPTLILSFNNFRLIGTYLIGLILQLLLFQVVLLGKNWAKIIMTILLVFGFSFSLSSMAQIHSSEELIFLIPMAIYSYGICLFSVDKDCIKFFNFFKEKQEQIGEHEQKGERKLVNLFLFLIAFEIFLSWLLEIHIKPINQSIIVKLMRILILLFVFYYVMQGKKWAKIITTILFIAGSIFMIIFFIKDTGYFLTILKMGMFNMQIILSIALIFFIPIVFYSYGIYLLNADKNCIKYFKQKNK
ncbi:MAG: hypothetical protein LBT56_02715 [Prevotellaceae bacterium]|jgi:hypothetical protein|nr:hypothetical protein [Prevotellaceae bacterium]